MSVFKRAKKCWLLKKDVKPLRENRDFYNTSSFCMAEPGLVPTWSSPMPGFICAMLLLTVAALGDLR